MRRLGALFSLLFLCALASSAEAKTAPRASTPRSCVWTTGTGCVGRLTGISTKAWTSGAAAPVTPTVRAVGTIGGSAAAVTPGLPAGTVAGDLLVMLIETKGDQAVTVSGWTQCPGSPSVDASTTITRITCFYKIAVGADATTTSDSGDHQTARVIAISTGTFNSSTPFDTNQQTSTTASGATFSITGITTTGANKLILAMVGADGPDANLGSEYIADASLTDITWYINDARTNGAASGASIALYVNTVDIAAGAYPAVFGVSNTTTTKANLMLAVNPTP